MGQDGHSPTNPADPGQKVEKEIMQRIALYPSIMALSAMETRATDAAAASDNAELTTKSIKIGDDNFTVTLPYAEGHSLNAAEASVLNQTRVENVRNNLNSKLKAMKEAHEKTAPGTPFPGVDVDAGITDGDDKGKTLRQLLQGYSDIYEFGVRNIKSAEPVDPVEREAFKLARETIGAQLKANNIKVKDLDPDAYEQAIAALAGSDADIRKEAQRRVKVANDIGKTQLDLSAITKKADAAVEEAAQG